MTYCLKNIQSDDAFESEKLEQDLMLLQFFLVLPMEPQAGQDSNGWRYDFQDCEPDVSEMHTIRLLAVCSRSKRGGSCDPNDE
jgi:hypothetical protein